MIVRPAGLIKARRNDVEDFGRRLGDTMIQGLRDATKIMVDQVVVVDNKDLAGGDLIVIPSNFYYEVNKHGGVMLSLDITLLRTKDGKESGMLVEGSAGPGKRSTEVWHRKGQQLYVMGAYLKNDRFG